MTNLRLYVPDNIQASANDALFQFRISTQLKNDFM